MKKKLKVTKTVKCTTCGYDLMDDGYGCLMCFECLLNEEEEKRIREKEMVKEKENNESSEVL